jgi:hypothetical protein
MTWLLMSLFGLALVALAGVGLLYGERQQQARLDEQADHAKCIAHIAEVTSNRFVAARLRELADKYDSIEERPVMTKLQRQHFASGPSVPSSWLNLQAELLDPTKFDLNEVAL